MFKSLRLKFRRLTFGIESIYQTQKLIKKPRPINVVRAFKLKKIQLAEDIISEEFKPLHVKLNPKQVSKNIDLVRWRAISPKQLELDININASNEDLEPTFKRIFDLSPLIKKFHTFENFKSGWIDINLGDYAKNDGLAFCSNRENQILIPDTDFISTRGYEDIRLYFRDNPVPWEQKKEILFWRGSSTGISSSGLWRDLQRIKLCELASNAENQALFDVGLSSIVQLNKSAENEIKTLGYLKDHKSIRIIHSFKYLIDVDGNSNAWSSLFLKLLSGSVVLKVESEGEFRQWYYDRLVAWEHFVPVKKDLSDLEEKLYWLRDNDQKAKEIASSSQRMMAGITFESQLSETIELISRSLLMKE